MKAATLALTLFCMFIIVFASIEVSENLRISSSTSQTPTTQGPNGTLSSVTDSTVTSNAVDLSTSSSVTNAPTSTFTTSTSVGTSSSTTSSNSSTTDSTSTTTTSETYTVPSGDPLLSVPGLPTMYHEDCATSYPNGTTTTCTSSQSTVGIPQTFNSTTDEVTNGTQSTGMLHENLYAFQLNASASIQFTFRGPLLNGPGLVLTVYFSDPGINFTDLRGEVDSSTLQEVTQSTGIPGGGGFSGGGFSGHINAQAGVYIFDFRSAKPVGSVYFIVRDATALDRGINVSIGPPVDVWKYFYPSACGSVERVGGEEQKFTVTVTSNSTSDVYLTTPDAPNGVWMEFSPSFLENVGPQGKTATLLLAGDAVLTSPPPPFLPAPPDVFNSSLFIDAFSPTNGTTGESLIALNNGDGSMHILNSPGPIGWPSSNSQGVTLTEGTNINPSSEENDSDYAIGGGVYDPTPGAISNSSLSVKMSGVGLMENGTEIPLPSWLQVTPANSSFVIMADQPYEIQVCVYGFAPMPYGTFTVALNEEVNGQAFIDEFQLSVQVGIVH